MLIILVATTLAVLAGPLNDVYPFDIDQDHLAGAPDFSFLNHAIGASDRTFVRDGHFYRVGADLEPFTDDDDRVRFFGVNLAFGANFPEERDAYRIARRLRRLGVNLVRLHHMDTSPDSNPGNSNSLLMQAPYPTLNDLAVRRLRVFLGALKSEGIYCNLNLHVGYTFLPWRDGVPPGIPSQSKPLQIIWPHMIELQQQYAREVIEALALNGDPVLAMVEINNESSLLQSWQWGELDRVLVGDYAGELRSQWNAWLRARYETTAAVRDAWGPGEPDGPELLNDSWKLEVHAPAEAILEGDDTEKVVRVVRGGAPVIAKLTGFSIAEGTTDLAEIEMRADLAPGQSRNVYWDVKQDVSPWRTEASKTVGVTAEWQKFSMAFTAGFDMDQIGRFGLSVENVDQPVHIRNWHLHKAGRHGLDPAESIEDGTVSLVRADDFATEARLNDYLLFLAARDGAYLNAILSTVREAAGDLVPVAGTQLGYGGLLNYDSHDALDYQDHHYYVDHYNFPHTPWDGRDWRVRDGSSVGSGMSAILNVAAARQAVRPYTVSEYNQPWPNTYAAEADATLAVVGAFQDWDAIIHFAYSHGRNWDVGVPNGFNINGDWTKWPNLGQSAWLFRSGVISAGVDPVEIPVSLDQRLRAGREKRNGSIAAFLSAVFGYDPALALVHPVRLAKDSYADVPELRALTEPYRADSGDFSYDKTNRRFLIHSPYAAGVFGFAGAGVTAGDIDITPAPGTRGYVALLLTALDGRAIADSEHLLLSNPGYTLRSQPGANPARPQAIINYPGTTDWWTIEPDSITKPSGDLNGGVGPVWMERVELDLTLRTRVGTITVYPLDGTGARLRQLASSDVQAVAGGVRIHLQGSGQDLAPWYEIVKSESIGLPRRSLELRDDQ